MWSNLAEMSPRVVSYVSSVATARDAWRGWRALTEVHEIGNCMAGGIPVLIGQLYFIFFGISARRKTHSQQLRTVNQSPIPCYPRLKPLALQNLYQPSYYPSQKSRLHAFLPCQNRTTWKSTTNTGCTTMVANIPGKRTCGGNIKDWHSFEQFIAVLFCITKILHEFHETCHSVTFIVLVNSHQRWKQTQNRVCFHLWCELTLASWCHSIVWSVFFTK